MKERAASETDESANPLQLLYQGVVTDEQIDHLGHMNVRFYLEKALLGTEALAAAHGLDAASCRKRGALLTLSDAFTRHYREQLSGAPLVVKGGVLGARGDRLRFYHELVNTERDELAAAFVHEVQLQERGLRRPLPIPEIVAKSAAEALVEWPEHGRPRTLDLERPPKGLDLGAARERGLAMREERVIEAGECDEDGFFRASGYQDLVWGGVPTNSRASGMPLFELEGGGKFGWATLESRGRLLELPRAGTRIQSFGAEVELARKTSCRHNWVFDVERGTLLCASSIVNLAFDIQARRAIEIPSTIRRMLEAQFHPDLR